MFLLTTTLTSGEVSLKKTYKVLIIGNINVVPVRIMQNLNPGVVKTAGKIYVCKMKQTEA